MVSRRTKACDISSFSRAVVKERDGNKCIFCERTSRLTIAHYIGRGNGGLGIPENLACACFDCHEQLDHGMHRNEYRQVFKAYLDQHYPNFPDSERIYNKWRH